MQDAGLRIYLKTLVQDGHKWQYTYLNGKDQKPKLYFTTVQWGILFVAVVCTPFLEKGFNKDFVSYTLTALSIFVGLFLTLILTAFDKFKQLAPPERPTAEDKRYLKTRKNFFKQFIALTAYAIVISLLCIVLLGIIALTETKFSDSILRYSFAPPTIETVWLFCKVGFKTFYNIVMTYFLLDFLVLVLYAVSSIHTFMRIEFDRDPLPKPAEYRVTDHD